PAKNDGPGVNMIVGSAINQFDVPAPSATGPYLLLPDTTYSWRVRTTGAVTSVGENDRSWGTWGASGTFRTPTRDATRLGPVSPAYDSTVARGATVLRWGNPDPDVFYYEVQVTTDPNFGEGGAVSPVWHNLVHGG